MRDSRVLELTEGTDNGTDNNCHNGQSMLLLESGPELRNSMWYGIHQGREGLKAYALYPLILFGYKI